MIKEDEALNRMAAYCAAAERCRSEVLDKLLKLGLPYEEAEEMVGRLVAERYIDEERYCRAYINDKLRFSKWGKLKIRQGLYLKKIPERLIASCLEDIDAEAYDRILQDLIAAKRRTVKGGSPYEVSAKLIRFALGRGFEMKDIYKFVRQEESDGFDS